MRYSVSVKSWTKITWGKILTFGTLPRVFEQRSMIKTDYFFINTLSFMLFKTIISWFEKIKLFVLSIDIPKTIYFSKRETDEHQIESMNCYQSNKVKSYPIYPWFLKFLILKYIWIKEALLLWFIEHSLDIILLWLIPHFLLKKTLIDWHTVFPLISAAALIKFTWFKVRRLLEGGAFENLVFQRASIVPRSWPNHGFCILRWRFLYTFSSAVVVMT